MRSEMKTWEVKPGVEKREGYETETEEFEDLMR